MFLPLCSPPPTEIKLFKRLEYDTKLPNISLRIHLGLIVSLCILQEREQKQEFAEFEKKKTSVDNGELGKIS